MYNNNFLATSLELHLFFGRIMKEHALFLKAGFTPANPSLGNKAEFFKKEFEQLLGKAVALSDGLISLEVLSSGELVTKFTASAEQKTAAFTGIPINKAITRRELLLDSGAWHRANPRIHSQVHQLNRRALQLLNGLIAFKQHLLNQVLNCEMFTANYPLLIEHIIREATLYREYIETLERDGELSPNSMRNTECFWDRIMMEHALFMRGLLDPSENDLISTADGFANDYAELLSTCNSAQNQAIAADSLEQTIKFRDFKIAGAQGILGCQIKSIILPLLADHVLREANHYIRLLES